jgi:DNA-binding response OmpR family regulator
MKRILFVEDEIDIRDLVKEEFESWFVIECVSNTKEAKALMEHRNFDFIIVDLHLGDGDFGTEVFKFIEETKLKINTELFILSGFVDLVKVAKDEYEYLLNPRNIYLKPQGTFDLFADLRQLK